MDSTKEKNVNLSEWFFALLIFASVFSLHALTSGSLYFADGPRHLLSIYNDTFVIQPPGYWLYARLSSLFPTPTFGLAFLNWGFSSTGASAFYFLCKRLGGDDKISKLASVAYVSLFYIWFAGDVHSTYASQTLFPPLLILAFLRYEDEKTTIRLLLCAATFAIGTGLRPSDGAFLLPLFCYLTFRTPASWKSKIQLLTIYGFFCLLWFVPNQLALSTTKISDQLTPLALHSSIMLGGFTPYTIANVLRVLVPLFIAFWPLLLAAPFISKNHAILILLWALPGLLFLLFVYMSDAPYLVYASGAPIVAVTLCRRRKLAVLALSTCLVWNVAFFFFAQPIPGKNTLALVFNYYGVKYTHFGISNRWMQNLSEASESGPWYDKQNSIGNRELGGRN